MSYFVTIRLCKSALYGDEKYYLQDINNCTTEISFSYEGGPDSFYEELQKQYYAKNPEDTLDGIMYEFRQYYTGNDTYIKELLTKYMEGERIAIENMTSDEFKLIFYTMYVYNNDFISMNFYKIIDNKIVKYRENKIF